MHGNNVGAVPLPVLLQVACLPACAPTPVRLPYPLLPLALPPAPTQETVDDLAPQGIANLAADDDMSEQQVRRLPAACLLERLRAATCTAYRYPDMGAWPSR